MKRIKGKFTLVHRSFFHFFLTQMRSRRLRPLVAAAVAVPAGFVCCCGCCGCDAEAGAEADCAFLTGDARGLSSDGGGGGSSSGAGDT